MVTRMDVMGYGFLALVFITIAIVIGPSGWGNMWWHAKNAWKGNKITTRDDLVEDVINLNDPSIDEVFSGRSPSTPVGPCEKCGADLPRLTSHDDPGRKNKALDMMSYLYIHPKAKADDEEQLCKACYDKLPPIQQQWYAPTIRITNPEAVVKQRQQKQGDKKEGK